MYRKKLVISIASVCILLAIGSAIALAYSQSYPTAEEPVNRSFSGDVIPSQETPSSDVSIPEGAVAVPDEEKATQNVIQDPLALRDPSTYTDEDLHLIAQKSVADELTMAELSTIREGMTEEQIKKVQEYTRLYRDLESTSEEDQ